MSSSEIESTPTYKVDSLQNQQGNKTPTYSETQGEATLGLVNKRSLLFAAPLNMKRTKQAKNTWKHANNSEEVLQVAAKVATQVATKHLRRGIRPPATKARDGETLNSTHKQVDSSWRALSKESLEEASVVRTVLDS